MPAAVAPVAMTADRIRTAAVFNLNMVFSLDESSILASMHPLDVSHVSPPCHQSMPTQCHVSRSAPDTVRYESMRRNQNFATERRTRSRPTY